MTAEMTTYLAASGVLEHSVVNIIIFTAFVAVTLTVVIRVSGNNKDTSQFTGGSFLQPQNGSIAIARRLPPMSAASFLGIAGAIAVGSTAFRSPGSSPCCSSPNCCLATGRFTMADVLNFRLSKRPVPRRPSRHDGLAVSTCWRRWPPGDLVALLLDISLARRTVDRDRRRRRSDIIYVPSSAA